METLESNPFVAYEDFIAPSGISAIKNDCIKAYGNSSQAEDTETSSIHSGDYHNSGNTYFFRACDVPRFALETLALEIFQFHTKNVKEFDPQNSGAEWWAQCVDSNSTIGFHWDRDYGKEDEMGINVYPKLATVTYLTKCGGPTLIVNKKGLERSKSSHVGVSDELFISSPKIGKHIAFDGPLLHAAPSDLIAGGNDKSNVDEMDDTGIFKRVTFLVNIWINNKPEQAHAFPVDLLQHFTPADEAQMWVARSKKRMIDVPSFTMSQELISGSQVDMKVWKFVNGGRNHSIRIPLPDEKHLLRLCRNNHAFHFMYAGCGLNVEIDEEDSHDANDEDIDYRINNKKKRKMWRPSHIPIFSW